MVKIKKPKEQKQSKPFPFFCKICKSPFPVKAEAKNHFDRHHAGHAQWQNSWSYADIGGPDFRKF